MSLDSTAVAVVGMIAFWAIAIWLFVSRAGKAILRVVLSLFSIAALMGCLYLHWEPYVAMVCLPAGFLAGVLFAEWHYGIRAFSDRQSKQEPQPQQRERKEYFQPTQRQMLDSGRAELTYRSDPGAAPHA